MQRRKTLINGLINSGIITNKEKIRDIFKEAELDIEIRGEKLNMEQFAKLSNLIYKSVQK